MTLPEWPTTPETLTAVQVSVAAANLDAPTWDLAGDPVAGGCFVAFARGEAGPGHAGDRAWAGAVAWQVPPAGRAARRSDRELRGTVSTSGPRQASDVVAQAVVFDRVAAAYAPGLLALREGPILAAAVDGLAVRPDVVIVDATGRDHPRRAGLAVHLGAVWDLPTVGVTHRPLVASGPLPVLRRGEVAPVTLDGEIVGCWVCTHTGARPVVAHAAWRTDPDTAADLVLRASTEAARTPVPLQEARRVAREARAAADVS